MRASAAWHATDAKDPLVNGWRLPRPPASTPWQSSRWSSSEVNQRVRWMHDLDNMGVGDFWANAGETLRRGTGDSEDIAIVKMQVLEGGRLQPKGPLHQHRPA